MVLADPFNQLLHLHLDKNIREPCITALVSQHRVEGKRSPHTALLPVNSILGSGTNGYVVRNLSALRSRDTAADRAGAWDVAPPKHREPDEAILEHERKRKVEVKCLELQLELEDKEYVPF